MGDKNPNKAPKKKKEEPKKVASIKAEAAKKPK
jgi:hypothetical protein